MDDETAQQHAEAVIKSLDGLQFTSQIAILIGVMLSTIIANAPETGEQIVSNIMDMLPRQYIEAKTLLASQ
jgi:hypothetical protein